jgi:hypothetical protein
LFPWYPVIIIVFTLAAQAWQLFVPYQPYPTQRCEFSSTYATTTTVAKECWTARLALLKDVESEFLGLDGFGVGCGSRSDGCSEHRDDAE